MSNIMDQKKEQHYRNIPISEKRVAAAQKKWAETINGRIEEDIRDAKDARDLLQAKEGDLLEKLRDAKERLSQIEEGKQDRDAALLDAAARGNEHYIKVRKKNEGIDVEKERLAIVRDECGRQLNDIKPKLEASQKALDRVAYAAANEPLMAVQGDVISALASVEETLTGWILAIEDIERELKLRPDALGPRKRIELAYFPILASENAFPKTKHRNEAFLNAIGYSSE